MRAYMKTTDNGQRATGDGQDSRGKRQEARGTSTRAAGPQHGMNAAAGGRRSKSRAQLVRSLGVIARTYARTHARTLARGTSVTGFLLGPLGRTIGAAAQLARLSV
jgi:hypothetical protein